MKVLRRLLDFYLDASIHVALSVFCLVQVTCSLFHFAYERHLSVFLFLGTIACYNFVKYGVEAKKYFLVVSRYHKQIQLLSFLVFPVVVYHAFYLSLDVWMGIAAMALFTGLYALPLLPNTRNLRSFGGLKIFMVALVWAGTTVILPALAVQYPLDASIWVETLQRFLLVLILLVPFEIRDLQYDEPELRTLPQRFGVLRTKLMGMVLCVVFVGLTYLKSTVPTTELYFKGGLFVLLLLTLWATNRKQSKYFCSFWVESIPVVWWLMIWGWESYT